VYSLDDSHIGAGPALNIRAIIFWMLALGGVFLLAFAYTGKSAVTANGNSLRVVMNQTGHFHIPGAVGPRQLNFLVDTGATTIAIPDSMRGALGVVGCESIVTLQTANGPVRGCATTLSAVDIGVFRLPNVKAVFMPNLKEPLLGMNAIGRFRMSQQAGMPSVTSGPQLSMAYCRNCWKVTTSTGMSRRHSGTSCQVVSIGGAQFSKA